MKFSTLNIVYIRLNFSPPHSKNPLYMGVKLKYPFKMCVFGRFNGSSRARPIVPFSVCE